MMSKRDLACGMLNESTARLADAAADLYSDGSDDEENSSTKEAVGGWRREVAAACGEKVGWRRSGSWLVLVADGTGQGRRGWWSWLSAGEREEAEAGDEGLMGWLGGEAVNGEWDGGGRSCGLADGLRGSWAEVEALAAFGSGGAGVVGGRRLRRRSGGLAVELAGTTRRGGGGVDLGSWLGLITRGEREREMTAGKNLKK